VTLESEHVPLTASEIMRAAEVAALLHVPVSTVHDWARSGVLPSRKRGKHRLFIRVEVERWLLSDD
jgi:excisionase family DNA binding protein